MAAEAKGSPKLEAEEAEALAKIGKSLKMMTVLHVRLLGARSGSMRIERERRSNAAPCPTHVLRAGDAQVGVHVTAFVLLCLCFGPGHEIFS